MSFRAIVLGAAAGGGLPQWNCGCDNCRLAREGAIPPASQSSLAVSADGAAWTLVNASPDLRQQLAATPALAPRALRHTPLASVILTNGDIDHVAGLLSLREGQAFDLWATAGIHAALDENPLLCALPRARVRRRAVALEAPFEPAPGLRARLFAVPGKVPLWREEGAVATDLLGEQTVGLELAAGARRGYAIPGCAAVTADLSARIDGADLLFFDGTLWRDDEMVVAGLGTKTGRRMGHVSMSGPEGAIAALAPLRIGRRVFVHMNNTNPVLRPGSPERREAEAAGWTIAADGLEVAA